MTTNLAKTPKNIAEEIRVPWYSKNHPTIPRSYVEPWKKDIVNREIICHNAKMGNIPKYEHDDSLYLDKREQLTYNIENRPRVDAKYELPPRSVMMNPPFHDRTRRYNSHMLARYPEGIPTEYLNELKADLKR